FPYTTLFRSRASRPDLPRRPLARRDRARRVSRSPARCGLASLRPLHERRAPLGLPRRLEDRQLHQKEPLKSGQWPVAGGQLKIFLSRAADVKVITPAHADYWPPATGHWPLLLDSPRDLA